MQPADQPRMGVRRSVLPFVLLYEAIPDTDDGPVEWVEIVRVVDGRRDLNRLF